MIWPGMGELFIILIMVLIIFGAGKLPQIGDALGKGIKNFKKATKEIQPDGDIPPATIEEKKEETPAAKE